MYVTLNIKRGVAVPWYYRSVACIPSQRACIGRIFLRVPHACRRFMHACTHASFLFWFFAPWYRARYKDMTDGGRLIGFFPRSEDARLKDRQVIKAASLVLSPEALLRGCASKMSRGREIWNRGSDSRASARSGATRTPAYSRVPAICRSEYRPFNDACEITDICWTREKEKPQSWSEIALAARSTREIYRAEARRFAGRIRN